VAGGRGPVESISDVGGGGDSRGCACHREVVIVENGVPEAPGPHFSKRFDMTMLAMTGGLERTPAEYDGLFEKAGLQRSRVFATPSVTVVEAVPV
jgi:hypothetical protein